MTKISIGIIGLILISTFGSCSKDNVGQFLPESDCSDTISFTNTILPLLTQQCTLCHDMDVSNGYVLDNYADISANAETVLKAMKGDGVQRMPKGGPFLNDTIIQQFSCWIDQGKLEN